MEAFEKWQLYSAVKISVKVLLQNQKTRLYYKSGSEWVQTAGEAFAFESSSSAFYFCDQLKLPDMQVVFHFPNDRYNFMIPCQDQAGARAPCSGSEHRISAGEPA